MNSKNVIFRSSPLDPTSFKELMSEISASKEILLSQDYLQQKCEKGAQPSGFEFSTASPVDLSNLEAHPKHLVMLHKISPLVSPGDILDKLNAAVCEEKADSQFARQFRIFATNGVSLSLKFLDKNKTWQLQWNGVNQGSFYSENPIGDRKRIANSLLENLTENMGLSPVNVGSEGNYLVGPEQQHARITICDPLAFTGISLERVNVKLLFSANELQSIIRGISEFLNDIKAEARIVTNQSQKFVEYQKWCSEHPPEQCCFAYMVESPVKREVIDFFRFKSDVLPIGFVPVARYQVAGESPANGFVEVSAEFIEPGIMVQISGRNLSSIECFCKATILKAYFSDDALLYS